MRGVGGALQEDKGELEQKDDGWKDKDMLLGRMKAQPKIVLECE